PYTLKVMTIVAAVMTPLVLIYQAWSYWVFRKRINPNHISKPESGVLDAIH
ncbi:MAG: cytochrome d ubiquinol oxidase subunit II, partial [Actinobacteria bacterium]|nr:cytochrome d ubiquinol oxidase subunit II [Actinomycetota bacterium]